MRTGHVLTVGITESGKTTANFLLAQKYQKQGVCCVILDAFNDPNWKLPGCSTPVVFFTNPDEFMAFVFNPKKCLQCALFIDEAGLSLNKTDIFTPLTSVSRHLGHVTHIIAQRAQQVSLTVRTQCKTLLCFQIAPKDAKSYAEDFNSDELLDAPNLKPGEFIWRTLNQPVKRYKVF